MRFTRTFYSYKSKSRRKRQLVLELNDRVVLLPLVARDLVELVAQISM